MKNVCVCVCARAHARACMCAHACMCVYVCMRACVCVTEIYVIKQYKSSRIKNHKITEKNVFDDVPLKGYIAS